MDKTCVQCGNKFIPNRSEPTCGSACRELYEQMTRKRNLENTLRLSEHISVIPDPSYAADFELEHLRDTFSQYAEEYGGFDYNPDFQRGHVWSQSKQIAFIEGIVRKTIPKSLMVITLNCPDFDDGYKGGGDLSGMCIVDGLQRVTAIHAFYDGEFKIFGDRYTHKDLEYSKFSLKRTTMRLQILSFMWKKDLLKYYIDINSGGVVHSDDEISRVKQMLSELS